MERNNRSKTNPWSLRHTGVYHHHSKELDLWILLHSVQDSVAEKKLLALEKDKVELNRLLEDPFRIHLLLASSYYPNWRWYLRDLGRQFNEKVRAAY